MQLRCGTPDIRANTNTGDLCGLCQLRSALKRPFLARLSPRRGYHVPSSRLRRSEIAAPPTTAYREKQMRKVVQFGCSLCIIFASLLHACLALYVEQVNERKMVCVCGARKSCFEASSFPAPTSIFGARLDHGKAAGTYQISHTGQAPARVVWKIFAC